MRRRTGLGVLIIAGLVLAGCTAEPRRHRSLGAGQFQPDRRGHLCRRADPVRHAVGDHHPESDAVTDQRQAVGEAEADLGAGLIEKKYDGRGLRLGRQIGSTNAYKRYLVSYRGDGHRLTGVMNVADR